MITPENVIKKRFEERLECCLSCQGNACGECDSTGMRCGWCLESPLDCECQPGEDEETLWEARAHREEIVEQLAKAIAALPLDQRVDALNHARQALHAVSPFAAEPVDCVVWVKQGRAVANGYNPNQVAPPEMIALAHSVQKYGYTMPIVGRQTSPEGAPLATRITDGFHRNRVGREDPAIRARLHGYLPFSLLKGALTEADEMSATILHNEARGRHDTIREVAIVQKLADAGWDAAQIGVGTVKSQEELIRMQQTGGAAVSLAGAQYGKAWDF